MCNCAVYVYLCIDQLEKRYATDMKTRYALVKRCYIQLGEEIFYALLKGYDAMSFWSWPGPLLFPSEMSLRPCMLH